MKTGAKLSKYLFLIIFFLIINCFLMVFWIQTQEEAFAWSPPGTYSDRAYNVSQSSMHTVSSYGSYTSAGSYLAYGYSSQDSHSRTKWHTQSTSTHYANYVMTIKLDNHIYNAYQRGYVTLKVTATSEFKNANVVADAAIYMKSFLAVGTISSTGLGKDNFFDTNTAIGNQEYRKFKNNSYNHSSTATISTGSSSSGQYVRFGASFQTKSDKSGFPTYSTALAQINSIAFKLDISYSGDTTNPTISGTNDAFTTSSSVTLSDSGSGLWKYKIGSGSEIMIASSSGATTSKNITISQGSNTIQVWDNVGRTATKTIKYYNPTVSITRYMNGSSSTSGGSVTLNGTTSLSQSGKTVNNVHAMVATPNAGYFFQSWQKVNGAGTGHTYGSKSLNYTIASADAYTTPLNFYAHFRSITTSNRTVTYNGNSQPVANADLPSGFTASYTYTNKSGTPYYNSTTAPSQAGSYDVTIRVFYTSTEMGVKTVTLTINPVNITITPFSGQSKIYGSADPTLLYGLTSGALVSGDQLVGSLSRVSGENASHYTITQGTVTSANNTNYNITFGTVVNFEIKKKAITVKADNKSITYGSGLPTFTFTYTGLVGSDTLTDSATANYTQYQNVGSYTITVTPKTYTNYTATYQTGTLTVNKKPLTVKADNKTITYGDNIPAFTFTYTGLVNNDTVTNTATVNYQRYDNVENYVITVTEKTQTNYSQSYETGVLVVNKKALTLKADNKAITYGEGPPSYTITFTGLVNGDVIDAVASCTYIRYQNVNTYTISVNPLSPLPTNYQPSYQTGTLTVNKKPITVKPNDKAIFYGEEAGAFTFTFTGVVNNDNLTASATTNYIKNNPVNSYTITVTPATYTNYQPSYQTGVLTVNKLLIVIRVNNATITYGDALPQFTFSFPTLVGSDTLTASAYVVDYTGDAGSYTIKADDQTYANYNPYFEDGTLTVNKAYADIVGEAVQTHIYDGTYKQVIATHPSGGQIISQPAQGVRNNGEHFIFVTVEESLNYQAAYGAFTIIINKADLTITANDISKEYRFSDPALTYSSVGLGEGDTFTGNLTRAYGEGVGQYAISIGSLRVNDTYNNYNVSFVPGTFTITRRNIEITANARSKIYGESDPSLTYSITSGSLVFGESLSGSLSRASGEEAGSYAINQGSITNDNNGNYQISYVGANFTINRRAITITAIEKTKVYGEDDPVFEYIVSSGYILQGDTLEGSLGRTGSNDVGTYAITQGTVNDVENSNYQISFIGNSFIITRKAITVTADDKLISYGDAAPVFTMSYIGLEYGDVLVAQATTNYNRYNNVGDYDINVTPIAGLNNYTATYVKGTLTVEKKAITIKADNKEITYGDAPPVYTVTYIGLVNGDTLTDTASSSYSVFDNAGDYVISVASKQYTNYSASYETGVLKVNKKTVTITPQNATITYGDVVPAFAISFSGLVNNDVLEAAATTVYQRYGNAGSYDITIVKNVTYTNYTPIYGAATLTVNKAPLTVKADDVAITYGDNAPVYTVTFEGIINNDVLSATATSIYQRYFDATSYAITVTLDEADTNYIPSYISGTLTVNKKALTISADSKEITYGDAPPVYTISYTGLVNNDELSDQISCSYKRYDNAGFYAITITRKTYTNYQPTYNDSALEVKQKAVTITADSKTITYGDAVPAFTISYTGLINNDQLSNIAITAYNRYDDAGAYDITVDQSQAYTNYTATYVKGTLTVNKAPLTVTVQDEYIGYGQAAPQFTFSYIGLLNNDILVTEAVTTYNQNDDVGSYAITITTTSYTNYIAVFNHGTLYVSKGTAIIIAELEQLHYYDRTEKHVQATLNHNETELVFYPASKFTKVGTYYVTVSSVETENFSAASVEIVFIIDKRQVFINVDAQSKIYGTSDPELTFSYTGLFEGDELTGSLTRDEGETVGSYQILLGSVSAGDNYQIEYTGSELTINPRPLTITAYEALKVYGDDDPEFTYSITEGNLIANDTLTGALSREEGRDVGVYEIKLGSLGSSNYTLNLITANLTISPRPITVRANDMSKIYGDEDPALTYTIILGSLAYDDSICDTVSRQEGEDVGVYPITINESADNNYAVSYEGNTFTIHPRPITITADAKTKTYGYDDELLTYYISEGNVVFDDILTGELTRQEGQNVGAYQIRQGTLTNQNNENYDITFVVSTYTITERDITLTAVRKDKVYGENDPDLTYEITEGTLAYEDGLTGCLARQTGENVGEYTVIAGTLNNQNNPNYNITFVTDIFEITRRPITVQARAYTKTYGHNEPPLPYDIVEGNLVFGDVLIGKLSREDNENQGQYPIYQGTLNNESNGNYDISFIGNTFTILPRYITITANRITKSYGDDDPELTFRVTSGSLAYSDRLNGALTRDEGEERGEYIITQGTISNDLNANYDITFAGNIFEIVKRAITVEADALSKIYGDDDPALTYRIVVGSVAFNETLTGEVVRETGENVGQYPITRGTLTNDNNINYEITYIEKAFSIVRRPITITPDDRSKTYGYSDPAFTYQITQGDLVFEDTITGLLSRQTGETVGSYQMLHGTLSNANNPNYEIILTEKYFVINKRAVALIADSKTKIYGNGDPEFTYGILASTPLVSGDVLTGELSRMPGENTGTYPITLGTLGNENYDLVVTMGNLIINPRPITVKAENISFLHGSQDSIDMTYTITGNPLFGDEEVIRSSIRISTSARPNSRVAEYPINLAQTAPLNNYTLTLVGATLTIIPGTITNVFFTDKSVMYDGTEHIIEATGNIQDFNVVYKNNKASDVGVYHATAIFSKENYNDLTLNARLVIMTNSISTSEIKPRGILKINDGVDPYVVPVIMQNNNQDIVALAQSALETNQSSREIVNRIFNIGLYENGECVQLNGTAEIRLLIPENVENLNNLRLIHISDDYIYDVSYVVDGEYVVFTAEELGNYAFITTTEELSSDDMIASILYYIGIGALVVIMVILLIGTFSKRKKGSRGRFV